MGQFRTLFELIYLSLLRNIKNVRNKKPIVKKIEKSLQLLKCNNNGIFSQNEIKNYVFFIKPLKFSQKMPIYISQGKRK